MGQSMTRRAVLLSTAAGGLSRRSLASPTPGLAAAAAKGGRHYGAAVRWDHLSRDADYRAAILRECDHLVPELELKWASVEPERGNLTLAPMDAIADFARQHGLRLHGHCLLWRRSIPRWAQDEILRTRDWNLVVRYVSAVVPRYAGLIETWDVVNEPLALSEGVDGLQPDALLSAFGPDYIRRALETARAFAPTGKLMINEYGLEAEGPHGEARRRRFLRLLDELRRTGAPLDGIGLQDHLDLQLPRLAQARLAAFVREIRARDLFVTVSELDVKERDYILPPEARDGRVATAVRALLEVMLDAGKVDRVTTWGLSDRYSWLEVTRADYARFPHAWKDGTTPGLNRGLPLDAAMRPKAMHQVMVDLLRTSKS